MAMGRARRGKPAAQEEEAGGFDFGNETQVVRIKPENQLPLTPEELEKDVPPRILTQRNPQAPRNLTVFSYADRQFKKSDAIEMSVCHMDVPSTLLNKDEKEAEEEDLKRKYEQRASSGGEGEGEAEETVQFEAGEEPAVNTLRNVFFFSERGSQTFTAVLRQTAQTTVPPPSSVQTDTVTQWGIYDAYVRDLEEANDEKEEENYALEEAKRKNDTDPLYSESMRLSVKLMERMVNLNAENEVYYDLKLWEDLADTFRDGDGTLLPLWRFSSERAKRKQVTAIKWNPQYNDLFAVGFGSYDFSKQVSGAICCYSLKNTKFPEYTFNVESGVCSLDWHPSSPALLVVGTYDGTALVFDVRARNKKPIYASTVRTNKHTDPVWEVRWINEPGPPYAFHSISSDGRVVKWTLMKAKLESESVINLSLTNEDDDSTLSGLAGGLCFDFSPHNTELFLVGTEEGTIHKCSTALNGQYIQTYEGHSMAVYAVRWNPYHPEVFLSASADWTVRLWNHKQSTALHNFDLAQAVGDIAWAPQSSTTFGACTSDGLVHVYDLSVNRNDRICSQKVVKRAKLTHLSFNQADPIVVVSDDRGGVTSLKLSPNLRKQPKDLDPADPQKAQVAHMDAVLEMLTD